MTDGAVGAAAAARAFHGQGLTTEAQAIIERSLDEEWDSGLVNLYGIESPGLTSALAIANHVCELIGERPPC